MPQKRNTGNAKPSRPDPEFQRDDLRNQTFYHVGLEYYPESKVGTDGPADRIAESSTPSNPDPKRQSK